MLWRESACWQQNVLYTKFVQTTVADPGGPGPSLPPRFVQIIQFSGNFKGKPLFEQILGSGRPHLGSKLPCPPRQKSWIRAWTRMLDSFVLPLAGWRTSRDKGEDVQSLIYSCLLETAKQFCQNLKGAQNGMKYLEIPKKQKSPKPKKWQCRWAVCHCECVPQLTKDAPSHVSGPTPPADWRCPLPCFRP